jgi:putative two-component system response regulator
MLVGSNCYPRLSTFLADSSEAVVQALARAVEARSAHTHGHSERVMWYCLALADVVNVGEHDKEVLRKGSLLHDVGKVGVPDAILDKPGKLTVEELAVIRTHPEQGVRIVEPLASLKETLPLIRWHHERLDGKGYPDGVPGAEIPLLVRILSVCDIYDSLASDRPYRRPLPQELCLRILDDNAVGGGLDRGLVEVFSEIVPSLVLA